MGLYNTYLRDFSLRLILSKINQKICLSPKVMQALKGNKVKMTDGNTYIVVSLKSNCYTTQKISVNIHLGL